MDPNSGRLYADVDAARRAGVKNPIEVRGELADIKRLSEAVARLQLQELEALRQTD